MGDQEEISVTRLTVDKILNTADLRRAIATLEHDQGRIARRNARRRVNNALAKLRRQLDEHFPALAKLTKEGTPAPRTRKVRSVMEQRKALIRDGWVVIRDSKEGGELLSLIAAMRLPMRRTKFTQEVVQGPSGSGSGYPKGGVQTSPTTKNFPAENWTPGWVAHYYPSRALLDQARHNTKMIQAANAAVRLGSLADKKGMVLCVTK